MNRYLPVVPLLGIVTTLTLQSQPVSALERSQVAKKVQEFTVQIDGEESGTGTIIERNGNTYTVITCWHVMDTPGDYQVMTPDGETHPVAEVKNLPNVDLAVIEFSSSNSYSVAELVNSEAITPGTSTYVVGYPDPIPGIPERTYAFLSAEVVSQLSKADKGYTIIHDNPSTPGGSGGGIFDTNGSLIGINGRSISDGNTNRVYGAGIPLQLYLATRTDLVVPSNITPPQDFVSLGQRKLKQEDYQGAIAEFSQALVSNPNNLDALSGRAEAYYWLEKFPAAIQDFDAVLERNPNNATFFFRRGYAYNQLKEHQKAISDYTEAIRLDPEYASAYSNRGASYRNLGEYEKAITDYNEAIRLDPDDALKYSGRSALCGNLEEHDKAIADATEAIHLDPSSVYGYINRSASYNYLGQFDQAIADATKAISIDPELAEAYYNRGDAYYNIGDRQKAFQNFYKAANLFQQQGNTRLYQDALNRVKLLQ